MKPYRAIAEYYDAEYAETAMLQQDVPFFMGQLPTRRQSILELCTGTARAAIPLAQAGHRVVGIDYDAALLEIATRKRDSVGLKPRELELIEADALTLDLNQKFDWVCIFFNTLLAFTTIEEQDQFMQVARKHLKPNGRFWIDIFNPDLQLLNQRDAARLDAHVFYVPALDRTVHNTTDLHRRLAEQITDVTFNYTWFDPRGRQHTQKNKFSMTWIFPRELRLLLERNGFKIEYLFGNYDGSKVKDDSPRLIARCVLKK